MATLWFCHLFADDELEQKAFRKFEFVLFFLIWLFGRPSSNQICIDYIEIPDPFAILRARIFGRFFLCWLKNHSARLPLLNP